MKFTLTISFVTLGLAGALLAAPPQDETVRPIPAALSGPDDPNLVEGSFRFDRGEESDLWIPPGEVLQFRVEVDLGLLGDATVGTVTMSSGVEPFVKGLPIPGQKLEEGGDLVAWIRAVARGGYLGYELDHRIETRYLPQIWPHMLYAEKQTGSENRRRELKVGLVKGEWTASYRGDGHCRDCARREHFIKATLPWNDDYHCDGCKRGEHRVWSPKTVRGVPPQSIEVLGAIYLARTMIREDLESLTIPMIQKSNLWLVTLTRGTVQEVEVSLGVYRCREISLTVEQPEGEAGVNKFSGVFGIKGALTIWVHETTGVPVSIEGDVPVGGIIDLRARVKLASALGTPESFVKAR